MKRYLEMLCRRLLEYDPDIVEIAQFGSSVYAPKHAEDIDLLIITGGVKEYGGYFDAANPKDSSSNVDVLVFGIGKAPRQGLLRGILGAFEILHGDGRFLLEYAKMLGDPTFDEARAALSAATDYIRLSERTVDPLVKDRHVREAFDSLFHAARIASMVYLSTDIGRWGLVRRALPEPYKSRFNEFVNTLHVRYFYGGEYPKEGVEEEFNRWLKTVEEYLRELECKVREKGK